jgi:hypothetical protein
VITRFLAALATTAALALAPSAHAVLIDDPSDDFSYIYSHTGGVGTNVISAAATFNVTSVSASTIQILVSVTNTSVLTTFANAGLTSIGLATSPRVTGITISGGLVFDGANTDDVPSLTTINLCAFADNNCNGGAQNLLLAAGASDTFLLTLTGNFAGGLLVNASGVKWQTSDGSYEEYGCERAGPCVTPVKVVPEPATLLLFGAGALGLAYRRRRAA